MMNRKINHNYKYSYGDVVIAPNFSSKRFKVLYKTFYLNSLYGYQPCYIVKDCLIKIPEAAISGYYEMLF